MKATTWLALLLGAAFACGESPAGSPFVPAVHPATPRLAHLRGTVDVATGTMTFEPVSASGGPLGVGAPNAAIYGDQGVSVRIYNSAVVTSASVGGKKTYSANVGVRNLLAYRIGDEQGAAAPADTMGIYVFLNGAPVVGGTSSSCPACAVIAKNASGTASFTAPSQGYWFYPELLGPANGGADTTLVRKQWVFEADTAVTRFSFDVLVSAPWAAPNESVWRVEYRGDSLPDTQSEPRWRKFATNGGPAATILGGLQLTLKKSRDSLTFVRRDSLSASTDALMEGRVRLDDGAGSATPEPGLAMDDNSRFIGAYLSDSGVAGPARIGFVDGTGDAFVAGASDTLSAVKTFRVIQLRKFAADSAVIYVDGVRRAAVAYGALPLTRASAPLPSYFVFGLTSGNARAVACTWDYVVYQIGQATP